MMAEGQITLSSVVAARACLVAESGSFTLGPKGGLFGYIM